MIVTLRGKLERVKAPEDTNAVVQWRWSGSWAFGRAVEMPASKSGGASLSGTTPSKQKPLPFLYTFERPEDPSKVAVPSLQKPVDPLSATVNSPAPSPCPPAPTHPETAISPVANDDKEEPKSESDKSEKEMLSGESPKATVSVKSIPPAESNADDSAQRSAPVSDETTKAAEADVSTTPAKANFISFADKLIPDWPDFTDAETKYSDLVPPSGLWKGYFETAVTSSGPKKDKQQHPPSTMPIHEECFLFLNCTPPKTARVSFEDTAANLLLAPGLVHVRGRGENQYGVFELLGSLNAVSGDLVIQRQYIVHPPPSTGPGRPRMRRTRDSQLTPNDASESGRPYFTRKRPMSWKKRAALEDEQESASPDASYGGKGGKRARSASVGPGCDVGKRARLDSEASQGLSGTPLTPEMASSSFGALPRLTVTIPGSMGPSPNAVAGTGPPGSASTFLPAGTTAPTSTPAGPSSFRAGGASGDRVPGHQGSRQPPTTALLAAAAASLAAKPGSKNSAKIGIDVGRTAAATTMSSSSMSLGASASGHLKLPPVGDPHKARWRAAHFLYYHRNDVEETGGNTPAKSPTSTWLSANVATGSKEAGSSGPKFVVYEGEMLNSHREGRGICLYSNGLLYEGQWRRDKEQGMGKLMTSDRKCVIYEGEWERGRMHGRGVYYYGELQSQPSNSPTDGKSDTPNPFATVPRYDGEFKENLRHGTGTYYLKDGSVYVGSWQNNVMSGRGVFTWPDGSVYDGDWKDGKRHGQGILRASDGFTYDGNWSQNSMDGRGSATYPNGQQYIGLFTAGRRDGRGTMLFTNGATYEGRFRDDAVDGQGTLRLTRSLVVPRSEDDDDEYGESADGKTDKDVGADQWDEKPDFMIPIFFQSDIGNIHRKAGFTLGGE